MHQISIEENIRRILITNKFTKTLRPKFGLDRHIDKNMTLENLSFLKFDILSQIKTYEPRINLEMINFKESKDGLNLELVYTLKGESLARKAEFKLWEYQISLNP